MWRDKVYNDQLSLHNFMLKQKRTLNYDDYDKYKPCNVMPRA